MNLNSSNKEIITNEKEKKHMKTTIKIVYAAFVAFALACFGLLPKAKAVVPPPDGGYPGGNTAEGQNALLSRTTGGFNTAVGWLSLRALTTGSFNTGVGAGTLVLNSGDENTATGVGALLLNTTGGQNTANGAFALFSNTTGFANTANGYLALYSNTIGSTNTADGYQALYFNTTGQSNTANGINALFHNTTGSNNTAVGHNALQNNTTGAGNTAVGGGALSNNTTAVDNIALGDEAGLNHTTESQNIDIGNAGVAGESRTIRIGTTQLQTFIAGISGAVVPGGVTVIVDAGGHLGTVVSSQRFKDGIEPMDKASEAILALKPVTFRYKHELDPKGIQQFGLVAEDVEKVNPDLVARDAAGKVYTVRYEAVNAMLLNEFLKEHRKNEEQEATIARQQKQIEALSAGLQKVSAQLELNEAAPYMANNDH